MADRNTFAGTRAPTVTRRGARALSVVALLACALLSGCGGSTEDIKSVRIERSTRLADLLGSAVIQSPLVEVDPALGVEGLQGMPRRLLHGEDFEKGAPPWCSEDSGQVVEQAEGGHALLARGTSSQLLPWPVLVVEPNTHYLFERRVKTEESLLVDFAVFEAKGGSGLSRASSKAGIRLHVPRAPVPDGEWQTGSVSFVTTERTSHLRITLRTLAGSAPPRGAQGLRTWFDGVRLYRIEPTPLQKIALLKGKAQAEGADEALGIHKRGRFPPQVELPPRHAPEHDNYSSRDALYAPPLTELAFPIRIQGRAVLRFSPCLWSETEPGAAARFEVLSRSGGTEQELWSAELTARGEDWRWHEASVDLAPLEDRAVELVLRTHKVRGDPQPLWGNPIIDLPPAEGELSNVILIAVDTLRADRLSCYGYGKRTSPNIDALAADGVRFDQVACNSNWTTPSFASIFTGMLPARHGVSTWGARSPLPAQLDTLAERFRDAGWATQSILYKLALYDGGYDQGFDVAYNIPVKEVRAEDNLAEALSWLEENAGRRNFLFLHFNDPHQPFNQPSPFDSAFGESPTEYGLSMPLWWTRTAGDVEDEERTRELHALMSDLYDGSVAYVDDRIGAFLAELKRRDLYEDAVIAFLSDHGEELWEHGRFGHGIDKLHDEVVRIPLILKPGRGNFARGEVVGTHVRGFDVMPTLLDLAGIEPGPELDAQSLAPMLIAGRIPGAPEFEHRVALVDALSRRAVAVRTDPWKYILRFDRRGRPREDLYDLSSDPGETQDLHAEEPGALQRMRTFALDYILSHSAGRYLVLLADAAPHTADYTLHGIAEAKALFGMKQPTFSDEVLHLDVSSAGPLVAACILQGDGNILLGATRSAAPPFRSYQSGDLARLIESGQRGIHLFEVGSSDVGPGALSRDPENLEQLEAMRALGYVDDEGR